MHHQGLQEDLTVSEQQEGQRLDSLLGDLSALSRSQIKVALGLGQILLNGAVPRKAGVRLREGDQVSVRIPPPPAPDLTPEPIDLEVLYEDSHLVVLVKPAGLVVHPAAGHQSGTLVHGLLYRYSGLSGSLGGDADGIRPGIVHRLDKNTSGVMVITRSDEAMKALAQQFAVHSIQRRYLALTLGTHLGQEGTLDTGHSRHPRDRKRFTGRLESSRRAITHYKTLEEHPRGTSLVACTLETGRTHQIRMHLAEKGAPILGDTMYGGERAASKLIDRQALHAQVLGFVHPSGQTLRFEAPPPEDFQQALDALRAGKQP